MIKVQSARYVERYKIYLIFNNQKKGIVDLQAVVTKDHRPIFNELSDINKFKKFKLEADTIVWENGLDLAPEFLYANVESESNNLSSE